MIIMKTCHKCNKEFPKYSNNYSHKRKYCLECNPKIKPTIVSACAFCKKEILGRKPHCRSKTGNIFCDQSCSASFYNTLKDFKKELQGNCATCNIKIKKQRKYCDICYKESLGTTILKQTLEGNRRKLRTYPI